MNMVEADLTRLDGSPFAEFGGERLSVPDDEALAARPGLRSFEGKSVILGIRPEDIEDASLRRGRPRRPAVVEHGRPPRSPRSDVVVHFKVKALAVLTQDAKELAVDVGVEAVESVEQAAQAGSPSSWLASTRGPRPGSASRSSWSSRPVACTSSTPTRGWASTPSGIDALALAHRARVRGGRRAVAPGSPGFPGATSAYQIEGAARGGRGSIWDTFSHTPARPGTGTPATSPPTTCTGSTTWPHVRPGPRRLPLLDRPAPRIRGRGAANRRGLDVYRGWSTCSVWPGSTAPVATLYHWTFPQALEDRGWTARDTAERFAEYAAIVHGALGRDVAMWITLNEPWVAAWLGYGTGVHAPGRKDDAEALAATHHLLLGHGLAVDALRGGPGRPRSVSR